MICSPLEMFRTIYILHKKKLLAIYRSQEIIFSDLLITRNILKDLLYIRNKIKIRTILRICSQYVLSILIFE